MKKLTSLLVVCAMLLTTISSMVLVSADVTSWSNPKIPATLVSGTFNTPGNVVDGDLTSISKSTGTSIWNDLHFTVDLGATYDLEGYNLYGGYKTSYDDPYSYTDHEYNEYDSVANTSDHAFWRMPTAWNLYYSIDGNSWLPLTSVTDNTMSLYQGSLDGYKARYIKYEQAGNFGNYSEWGWIRELEVYGSESHTTLASYDVNFIVNGEVYKNTSVTEGFAVSEPTADGYSFGWFADEAYTTKFDFSQPITADTTIYGIMLDNTHFILVDPASVTYSTNSMSRPERCAYLFSSNFMESTGTKDNFYEILVAGKELVADLGQAYIFDGFSTNTDLSNSSIWCSFIIHGSNDEGDEKTWTPLTHELIPEVEEYRVLPVLDGAAGKAYRFVKLTITSKPGWTDWAGIKMYGTLASSGEVTVNDVAYADGAVTATIDNTTSGEVTGIIITAVYNGLALDKVISQPISIGTGVTDQPFSQTISAAKGNTIKVFIFDSYTGLKPILTNASEITVE